MPGFDRTGPQGAGPMTGGRRGYCNPATAGSAPAYFGGYGYGRGLGLGRGPRGGYGPVRGMGRGYGREYGWYPVPSDPVYSAGAVGEIEILKEQAEEMKRSLAAISNRISEMEKDAAGKA